MKGLHLNLTQRKPGQECRKPMRTLEEMAEEFGVSLPHLANRIRNSKTPRPSRMMRASAFKRNTYCEPEEFRAWWRAEMAITVTAAAQRSESQRSGRCMSET